MGRELAGRRRLVSSSSLSLSLITLSTLTGWYSLVPRLVTILAREDGLHGTGERVRGAGAGHRRSAAERRQLHGAHAALVPRARGAGAAGQGVRRARPRALHLGRHLSPLPQPRIRPRAPIRRPRKHGEFTQLPYMVSIFSIFLYTVVILLRSTLVDCVGFFGYFLIV